MATDRKIGITLKHVYKIFGPESQSHIQSVLGGMTKAELLEKHNHVLGLNDVSIDMPAGGIQVIMGLSGSGKSTLIRHINRLIEPTSGEILVDGVDVTKMSDIDLREFRRHQTAMVFQKFALLPHWTVLDNAAYGLRIQGIGREERNEKARRWIRRVGLEGFEDRYPNQLSGGMQQRVGLARALTVDAPILLMDEAFSALDPLIRVDMQTVLLDIQSEIRKSIVFITHDLDEALRLGDRIAILRDGVLVQQGRTEDIVLRPADDYIASFVKEVNRARLLKVEALAVREAAPAEAGLRIPGMVSLEEAARMMTEAGVSSATLVDETGVAVGWVGLKAVVGAMARAPVVSGRPMAAA